MPELPGKRLQQVDDPTSRLGVQIPRRFVGENETRSMHNRARNSHPLLFTTGQFAWRMVPPRPHADRFQHLLDTRGRRRSCFAFQQERQGHIVCSSKTWDEVECLEDNPHAFPSHDRPLGGRQAVCAPTFQRKTTRRRSIQPRNNIQERALPASTGADECAKVSAPNLEIDITQGQNA